MNTYIIDIEADSLTPSVIWVVGLQQVGKEETEVFLQPTEFLQRVDIDNDIFVAHNGIDYDFPAIKDLWGIELKNVRDTLVMSRLFQPDREGGHSLRAWGERLEKGYNGIVHDIPKLEFSRFDKLSDEMIEYCKRDVQITCEIYLLLKYIEGTDFSEESIQLEHEIASIIAEQSRYGFYLNQKKAIDLMYETQSKADCIRDNVQKYFPPKVRVLRTDLPKYRKDGTLSKVGIQDFNMDDVCGNFWKIDFEKFNPASHKQVVERMDEAGWEPVEFTPKGAPKVNEANLATLPETAPEAARKLSEWKMLETRWKTVESWLHALGSDGRVHGKVFSMGAVTGRMTHAAPNMANIVSVYKPYGKKSRECWTVPNDNYRICGMDAQGLELRMLAHYMNDKEYAEEVVNGDPHSVTMKALGIDDRAMAKTFIYAFLYGASALKLSSILNVSMWNRDRIKKRFLNNMPSLQSLLTKVETVANRGYVRGIDGRRLYVRHAHAALNTLLQGGGAILCKKWSICMDRAIRKEKLRANLVNTVHDELQFEVHKEDAERMTELSQLTIREAGRSLGLRVPMDAESKIGFSWADTH
jgi:DNA polymerase-1